jgi:putative flippase GtrA
VVISRTRDLLRPLRGLLHEIAKFGVIGIIAYVLTVALSNWLHFGPASMGPITALGVAMILAATLSYFANRHWTWRHMQRQGVGREYGLFILLSVVGLVLTELPVGFSEYVLGLHSKLAYNISGNLIGTGIGTVWRFWSFKRWVFLPPVEAATREAAEAALI